MVIHCMIKLPHAHKTIKHKPIAGKRALENGTKTKINHKIVNITKPSGRVNTGVAEENGGTKIKETWKTYPSTPRIMVVRTVKINKLKTVKTNDVLAENSKLLDKKKEVKELWMLSFKISQPLAK
jgi:hypothetical protein